MEKLRPREAVTCPSHDELGAECGLALGSMDVEFSAGKPY